MLTNILEIYAEKVAGRPIDYRLGLPATLIFQFDLLEFCFAFQTKTGPPPLELQPN